MPKYNLAALGDEEFERMSQSLVQQIIGPGAKVYGIGSDGAREATFHGKAPYPSESEQWDGDWIFQVKFHDVGRIGPKQARNRLLSELDSELRAVTQKYEHPCDNYILITNVSLTPVFQKGLKDKIENEIIPRYQDTIEHIHVWGGDEVCRFLDAHADIRQAYGHLLVCGDLVGRLMGVLEGDCADLDELIKLYCEACLTRERSAVLDDARDLDDKPIALQKIFIDLDVRTPALPDDPTLLGKLPLWLREADDNGERKSALSYLLDDTIPSLVVVGGPGEGKSTLGQYLAQIHRLRLAGKLDELGDDVEELEKCTPRVPFRILLRDYAQWMASEDDLDSIFHYLAALVKRESGKDVSADMIHEIVRANPVLLILDGLDEVSAKTLRNRLLDNITSFVNQARDVLGADLKVVATTRPHGYSEEFDPSRFLHLTLEKLSPEKVVLYATRWTGERERDAKHVGRILETLETCLADKVVAALTQTPLQVTILLVIIRARGTPPKQREELFNQYMDTIYEREQKNRPELLRTEQAMIYGLHKYLAYVLHRRAEKDSTGALMELAEFRERVEEYLVHSNPLLHDAELQEMADQIITEASLRLVLIESPQEGKIGFGLSTTREFFAAAHLVDTAKGSGETDARFKAIARSPHWRNVALFFAGRVARTRPGEAPSLIDVCREIDTESADVFLRRGAELVIEVVDDRALRVPHNEIGAIQYGLTLLDAGFVKNSGEFVNRLKGLLAQYRERVVRPWLEDRLNNVVPEGLELYAETYQQIFGFTDALHGAIQTAAAAGSQPVKSWALSKAVQNGLAEEWVIHLIEELPDAVPIPVSRYARDTDIYSLARYLLFDVSEKTRVALATALLRGVEGHLSPHGERLSGAVRAALSVIKPDREPRDNSLYAWAVCQLALMAGVSMELQRQASRSSSPTVNFFLPGIAAPSVQEQIRHHASWFEEFSEAFGEGTYPLTKALVAVVQFLLNPGDPEYFTGMVDCVREPTTTLALNAMLRPLLGALPRADMAKCAQYHSELHALCGRYRSDDQFVEDMIDLRELTSRDVQSRPLHALRLLLWAEAECAASIEEGLDAEVTGQLTSWLSDRGVSRTFLSHCVSGWTVRTLPDFSRFVFQVAEDLTAQDEPVPQIALYWMSKSPSEGVEDHEGARRSEQLRKLWERALADYSAVLDGGLPALEQLYWCALAAGVVEETQMAQLYKIARGDPQFMSRPWYADRAGAAEPFLKEMAHSQNLDVARLAGASLSVLSEYTRHGIFFNDTPRISAVWEEGLSERLWELGQNEADPWYAHYIRAMAHCWLSWADSGQQWLDAMQRAGGTASEDAWNTVIRAAGCRDQEQADALRRVLLRIMESRDSFAKSLGRAAFHRLSDIVSEMEPVGFEERPLSLPLSRRSTAAQS